MAVLGFNYTKLHAERMKPAKGKVSINNNVSITDAEEAEISFREDQKALKISFKYGSRYEPEVAKIEIEGNLLFTDDNKVVEEMLKEWKENGKFSKEKMTDIINNILAKCNVEAILLSRDLNVPSPIPLPKVNAGKK